MLSRHTMLGKLGRCERVRERKRERERGSELENGIERRKKEKIPENIRRDR